MASADKLAFLFRMDLIRIEAIRRFGKRPAISQKEMCKFQATPTADADQERFVFSKIKSFGSFWRD